MGGYCLADISAVFIFYNHSQADCRVPRHIGEAVRVIYSCPWCQAILMVFFPPSLLWKTAVRRKEQSVLLTFPGSTWGCHVLLGREPCTNPQNREVFLLYHSLHLCREQTAGRSLLVRHRTGTPDL